MKSRITPKNHPLWTEILELARHTPSPHNVQPWKFRLEDPLSATLFIDRARTLPKEDKTGSFVLSAMSMMTESLSLIAQNRNHTVTAEIIYRNEPLIRTEGTDLVPFARLRLASGAEGRGPYRDDHFRSRRTSRLRYSAEPVSADALSKLGALVSDYGHAFGYTADPAKIGALLDWNVDALFDDLNDPDYHGEISEYFRWTDRSAKKHRDGLDFRCMNVSRFELFLSTKAPFVLKIPGLRALIRARYLANLGPIPAVGWIAGDFWEPHRGIEAGKCLIRFWLETTRLGLYFHPFGNLVTNPATFRKTSDLFGNERIWLVFKLGHSAPPPASRRLNIGEILVD